MITYSLTLTGFAFASTSFSFNFKKKRIIEYTAKATRYFLISSIFFISYLSWIGLSGTYELFDWKLIGKDTFTPVTIIDNIHFYISYFMEVWLGRIIIFLGTYFFSAGLIKLYDSFKIFYKGI